MTHYRSTPAADPSLASFVAALLGTLHARRPSARLVRRRLREISVSAPTRRALASAWTPELAGPAVQVWIHG